MLRSTNNLDNAGFAQQFRAFFKSRDFIFHDGRDLRRFSLGAKTQAVLAGVGAVTVCFSGYGVTQAAINTALATGLAGDTSIEARLINAQRQMVKMQQDVAAMKAAAEAHAARVEQRQAMIAAALSGKVSPDAVALPASDTGADHARISALGNEVIAPLSRVEARQVFFAYKTRQALDQRYNATAAQLRRLGLSTERMIPAMGGPYEPVDSTKLAAIDAAEVKADAQFHSLFVSWKKLDSLEQAVISIPSMRPVENLTFTSNFGVRSDPFRGTAAMHAGVDIPGPIGTPVYATADGVIERAGRAGGYGNLVEINHGRGIETRYGHLSKILVMPNSRVRRGQMIGLMGSTGRSTGSHLHYEVRIDGTAVNPIPYLENSDALVAIQDRAVRTRPGAVGGPADGQD